MAPVNDNVADAVVVPLTTETTYSATTVDATIQSGWEDHANVLIKKAVWYKFTTNSLGSRLWVQVTRTGGDAGFSPAADIWEVTSAGAPTSGADLNFYESVGNSPGNAPAEDIGFLEGSKQWLISVSDYDGSPTDAGTFSLRFNFIQQTYWDSIEADLDEEEWLNTATTPAMQAPWTRSSIASQVGTFSLRYAPTGESTRSLWRPDLIAQGPSFLGTEDVDYWIAYNFMIPDWGPVNSGVGEISLPGWRRGSSSAIAFPVLLSTSSTTGELFGCGPEVPISSGIWYEYRASARQRSSDDRWIVQEFLNGVSIFSGDCGLVGSPPTGIGWRHLSAYTGGIVYVDPLYYAPLEDPGEDIPQPSPPLDPGSASVTVFVNRANVTSCVLSGSVTRKLNRPWQATFRMPIDCSVMGPGKWVHIYFNGTIWFSGRIMQMSDECDEDFCYTEYTCLDASEIWQWRPARDGPTSPDPGDMTKPDIIHRVKYGPQIIEELLEASENPALIPKLAEGTLYLQYGTFAGGPNQADLSGAPVDWPMTIAEVVSLLTDTGEVDVVLTPIDSGSNLAKIDVYNGNYGTNRTASVFFDYGTGNYNVRQLRQTQDMSNVNNKLWYYFGPRIGTSADPAGDQHWCFNITGDDSLLPGNTNAQGTDINGNPLPGGALPGRPAAVEPNLLGHMREDSQDEFGVRMEVKIFDAMGDDCGESNKGRDLYRRLWQIESWLRAEPRTLAHVVPVRISDSDLLPPGVSPVQLGDFDIGDLVTVRAGSILRGGFTGAQRIYEYTVSWDEDGVIEIGELLTSADQEGI